MKAFIQLVGLILIIAIVWYWVKTDRDNEFKYNLPTVNEVKPPDSVLAPLYSKPLSRVPLLAANNFDLNETHRITLANLNAFVFDSLKLDQLPTDQIPNTSLANLDAATIIQLIAYLSNQSDGPSKVEALKRVGLLLNNADETLFFVKTYLMSDNQWLFTMVSLHRQIMQEPNSTSLNHAYLVMIQPASTEQTLEYLIEVQFLDRGPTDDYYEVNKAILERFDKSVLQILLDKVDDYAWYAAYPERDAEQGILEILSYK